MRWMSLHVLAYNLKRAIASIGVDESNESLTLKPCAHHRNTTPKDVSTQPPPIADLPPSPLILAADTPETSP